MLIRVTSVLVLLVSLFAVGGCATQDLSADVDPSADLGDKKTFYVQRFGPDTRGVEQMIAAELGSRGKVATYGEAADAPEDVDAIVTYVDKWMWDITMYMLQLRVEIRDPETGYILASGQSHRTSLVRKDAEGMVAEVIGEIMREAR